MKQNKIKAAMIREARNRYGTITPCANMPRLTDCFTVTAGRLTLWFNSADHSTHVIMRDL